MKFSIVALLLGALIGISVCAHADASVPNDNDALKQAVEQAQPLRLTVVWGKTTQPLPSAELTTAAKRNASDAAQPTPTFLQTARQISVATAHSGSGSVSIATGDLVYRLARDKGEQYSLELAIDTRSPHGSASTRTTLGLHLGQWLMADGIKDHYTAQVGGEPVESTAYRYQFICLADQHGCHPALPDPGITP